MRAPLRAAALTFLLGASALKPDLARAWTLTTSVELEYSTYLDIYAAIAMKPYSGFGPRLRAVARRGALALGAAFSVYPVPEFSESVDLFAGYCWRWSWGGALLGFGLLHTSDGSTIPTYTDVDVGPSLHIAGTLRWDLWRNLFVTGSLGVYLYPTQPLVTVPVGVDLRWSVGAGIRWGRAPPTTH